MTGLLLNSLSFGDKHYSFNDVKGFKSKKELNLREDFYGGRCNHLAKTEDKRVFLVVEKQFVIDIYIPEPTKLLNDEIKAILDYKKLDYDPKATKNEMLAILGVKIAENKEEE